VFALPHDTESHMDRTFNLAVSGAAVTILVLAVVYGPVVTAFIVAGSSFALVIALIAFSGVQSVERWWHGHSFSLRRTKTH
jgi:hypothetical protein